ncbi:sigma-70 family RNA polymerase sigma factor [Sodalis sp. RH14]|uniref:sigma-70 family RNA polymerase sigma factor n=1 Tax=Sodalis sp. RH14 TaxID=3394329 RepID=UPI0039B3D82A
MTMSGLTDRQIKEVLPQLRRFALWLTRNPAGADDLVQSGLEKALTAYAALQHEDNLRVWLFSILYRQFIDGERRKKRYLRLLSLFKSEEEYAASPEDLALTDGVLAGFASLPSDQRAILLLVAVEGLRYKEVAEALDIPLGTVMSRLSRARRQLHDLAEGTAAPVNPSLRRLK